MLLDLLQQFYSNTVYQTCSNVNINVDKNKNILNIKNVSLTFTRHIKNLMIKMYHINLIFIMNRLIQL